MHRYVKSFQIYCWILWKGTYWTWHLEAHVYTCIKQSGTTVEKVKTNIKTNMILTKSLKIYIYISCWILRRKQRKVHEKCKIKCENIKCSACLKVNELALKLW